MARTFVPLGGLALTLLCAAAGAGRTPAQSPAPASTPAHRPGSEAAFRRAGTLRHGINTGIWFAQSPRDYSVARLRSFTTADDLQLIHRLGFDHIRLSIDPDPLVDWQRHSPAGDAFVAELDHAVDTALADGLAVIVDIHPESAYKQRLLQSGDAVQRFALLWRALAQHYSNRDPERVFFELMNEPEQTDTYRWQGVEAAVTAQVRAVAPEHTVIVAGAHWSGLPDLLQMEPIADGNAIYTFHDYEPFAFTHQAATWADVNVQPLRGVPYPSSPEAVVQNEQQEPTLAGEYFIAQYGMERWDAARVDATLAFAERWGIQHGVPVYCGEFGVHRKAVADDARYRWLHDMRVGMEAHGIGWAMWDYQTDFGAVTKRDGKTTPDDGVIQALGLHPAP